ncbi:MAG: DUF1002 domain-containing protein [Tepidanaerobacter acetatoxydans]|uniref:DUF1002 domain-containing protein n=1 Tax=Tepidanaerobacter TaxID=499228 RepID=UPI000A742DDE|nr:MULTISPECIES: DUF1002 domain-containing protein [Tepidanaerobacter]NLU11261.1 DUF1002 domain-containing protein [Tepidanaerobacter acetatoxydans]
MKKLISMLIITSILITLMPIGVLADQADVVIFGADITQSQRQEMLKIFNVNENDVMILTVTNDEEREYLEGLVPEQQIGTRAISSAYVKLAPKNSGIKVETYNITWVTKEMYANAMVTAGIEDAEVIAAAPFKVSGTAALTGIMKAFEKASGKKLSQEAKKTASEELVLTGDLGEEIGKDKAAKLVQDVKKQVVKQKIKNPEDIRNVIKKIAAELDIELTEEQINQIMDLMKRISKLDLDINKISKQLDKISSTLGDVKKTVEENKGLIQKILDAINHFLRWLQNVFSS